MDGVKNPIVGYADSYRLMQRDGAKTIDIWSIITDLERNMVPAVEDELAALRKELAASRLNEYNAQVKMSEQHDKLTAAEQRNAALTELLTGLPEGLKELSGCENTAGVQACIEYVEYCIGQIKPTESGASDKCASDGGTCGLGGHCGECPHVESGASE